MKLIAGLGNKGREYEATRHNIGFEFLDYFAGKNRIKFDKRNKYAVSAEKNIRSNRVVFIKPLTFMNLSGEAVKFFAKKHKIKPADILIIHDEIDLPVSKIKIKKSGGDAGHNGIASIIEHLNTGDFARVRIGVGKPGSKGKTVKHVLGKLSDEESEEIQSKFDSIEEFVYNFISQGYEKAIGRFKG